MVAQIQELEKLSRRLCRNCRGEHYRLHAVETGLRRLVGVFGRFVVNLVRFTCILNPTLE